MSFLDIDNEVRVRRYTASDNGYELCRFDASKAKMDRYITFLYFLYSDKVKYVEFLEEVGFDNFEIIRFAKVAQETGIKEKIRCALTLITFRARYFWDKFTDSDFNIASSVILGLILVIANFCFMVVWFSKKSDFVQDRTIFNFIYHWTICNFMTVIIFVATVTIGYFACLGIAKLLVWFGELYRKFLEWV